MLELLLAAQAALNLYQWEPATGPVFGYHVYVNGELVQTTYEPEAWLDIAQGDVVEVQAVDSQYRAGPLSEASGPHDRVASAVLRDTPACLADIDRDGLVTAGDYVLTVNRFGTGCECVGDMDGDLLVAAADVGAIWGLIGQTCE